KRYVPNLGLVEYRGTWRDGFSARDYEASPEELGELLKIGEYDPSLGVHCFNHALALMQQDPVESDLCAELLAKAYEDNPENHFYSEGLARFNQQWGKEDDEKALYYFEKAMALDPREIRGCSEEYWTLLAKVRKEKGDLDGS